MIKVKTHSRGVKGKGNTTVRSHARTSKKNKKAVISRSHLVWKNPRTGERQLLPSENARNSVYVGFGIRRGIKKGLGKVKRGLKKLIS